MRRADAPDVQVQDAAVEQGPGQHRGHRGTAPAAAWPRRRAAGPRLSLPGSHQQQGTLGQQYPPVAGGGHVLGEVEEAKPVLGPALFRLQVSQADQQPGGDRLVSAARTRLASRPPSPAGAARPAGDGHPPPDARSLRRARPAGAPPTPGERHARLGARAPGSPAASVLRHEANRTSAGSPPKAARGPPRPAAPTTTSRAVPVRHAVEGEAPLVVAGPTPSVRRGLQLDIARCGGASQPSIRTESSLFWSILIMIVRLSLSNVTVRLCSSPRTSTSRGSSAPMIRASSASMRCIARTNLIRSGRPAGMGSACSKTSRIAVQDLEIEVVHRFVRRIVRVTS